MTLAYKGNSIAFQLFLFNLSSIFFTQSSLCILTYDGGDYGGGDGGDRGSSGVWCRGGGRGGGVRPWPPGAAPTVPGVGVVTRHVGSSKHIQPKSTHVWTESVTASSLIWITNSSWKNMRVLLSTHQ